MGKTKARPEGDVSVGLDRWDSLPEAEHVSLKQLTLRVCMLLALVTGQRTRVSFLESKRYKIQRIIVHYPLFRETQAVKARISCGTS